MKNQDMLTMYKQITIKTLHKQGLKQSAIAKQLGCHRHTIANILQRENCPTMATFNGKVPEMAVKASDRLKKLSQFVLIWSGWRELNSLFLDPLP